MHSVFALADRGTWADELNYFIAQDPRQFDFAGAYGNPGTPLLEVGVLLHGLFNISYENAVTLSVSFLVSLGAAACSFVCFVLFPESAWWLATACTLLFNRLYISTTPPTAVVMPLTALIVLAAWWIIKQQDRPAVQYLAGWGAVVGLACATRIEVTLLVGTPMLFVIAHRLGRRAVPPILAGSLAVFFLADPYLWFMPLQHLADLVRRFTINYAQYPNIPIFADELVHALWLASVCCVWCITLFMRRRLPGILPGVIIMVLIGITLLMIIVVFSSNYKPARYFFPVAVVWEVILALLALDAAGAKAKADGGQAGARMMSYVITGLLAFIQLSFGVTSYIFFQKF